MSFYNHELSRKNKRITKRRFSAGYGDLALDNQQGFFRLLDMDRIGVSIIEESILVPEKSVTAIAGIVDL
jgi:cobalamin-dependent methionine synthase I